MNKGLDINFALRFVNEDNPGWLPQTNDEVFYCISILFLFVLLGTVLFWLFYKKKSYNVAYQPKHCETNYKPNYYSKGLKILIIIIAIFIATLSGLRFAYAGNTSNDKIDNLVIVYVNDESKSVRFSTSTFENVYDTEMSVSSATVSLADAFVSDPELQDSNIKINALGGEVYNSKPNAEVHYNTDAAVRSLGPHNSCEVQFAWDISYEKAIELINSNPLNITLDMWNTVIVPPNPSFMYMNETYDALCDTCQYTAEGELSGKNVGDYTAVLTSRLGFRWPNSLQEDYTVIWKIVPYELTSDSSKEAYICFAKIGDDQHPYEAKFTGSKFDVEPYIVNNLDSSTLTPIWALSGPSTSEVKKAGQYNVRVNSLEGEGATSFVIKAGYIDNEYIINKADTKIETQYVHFKQLRKDEFYNTTFEVPLPKVTPEEDDEYPKIDDKLGLIEAIEFSFDSLPEGFSFDNKRHLTIDKKTFGQIFYLRMYEKFYGDNSCNPAQTDCILIIEWDSSPVPKAEHIRIPDEIEKVFLHDEDQDVDFLLYKRPKSTSERYADLPRGRELYFKLDEDDIPTFTGGTLYVRPNEGVVEQQTIFADYRFGDRQSDYFAIPTSDDYSKPILGENQGQNLLPFTRLDFSSTAGSTSGSPDYFAVYKQEGRQEELHKLNEVDRYFPNYIKFHADSADPTTLLLNQEDLKRVFPGAEDSDYFGIRALDTSLPAQVIYSWNVESLEICPQESGSQIVSFKDYKYYIYYPYGVTATINGVPVTYALPGETVQFSINSSVSYTKFAVLDFDGKINWECVSFPASEIRTGIGAFDVSSGRNSITMPKHAIDLKAGDDQPFSINLKKDDSLSSVEYIHSGIYDGSMRPNFIYYVPSFKFGTKLASLSAVPGSSTVRLVLEYPSGARETIREGYQFFYVPFMYFAVYNRASYNLDYVSLNSSGYAFSSEDGYINYSAVPAS